MTKPNEDDLLAIPEFLKAQNRPEPTTPLSELKSIAELEAEAGKAFIGKIAPEPESEQKAPRKKPKDPRTIQQKIRDQVSDLAGELEEEIDKFVIKKFKSKFDSYKWLSQNDLGRPQAELVASIYKPQVDELDEVLGGEDEQLNEGYGHMTKKQVTALRDFTQAIVENAERWAANKKSNRKVRKKKKPSVERVLKHFNFMEKHDASKTSSIDPASIIGAQELWYYNTAQNKIGVLRAEDRGGLEIRRSTIFRFDEKSSFEKKPGFGSEAVFKKILEGGKVTLRKLEESINTKSEVPSGRINKKTILLRVVK
tara:strand:- start:4909 stop:5841 length:933 start_codon:yes stop_codon:yes gene_type:complete